MIWILFAALFAQAVDFETEGLKALDAQKYEAAVELFSKALAADPKNYGAQFNLALAYGFLNKDAEAIDHYKAVLELKPGLYEAQLNLGITLLRTKQGAAALPHLQAAAAAKPKEYRPIYYVGEAALASGQFAEAEQAFTTALTLKPDSAAAESGLGFALARQNRRKHAEPHLRKAVALDPKYKDTLLELASLYEANHERAEAIALYREFPENPGARERMGALLLESGRAADAIPDLEAAVAKSPTSANRVALAQAYERSKQVDKALPLVEKALADDPKDFDLRMYYGRMLRDQRKFDAAAQQFFVATKVRPDALEAWNELSSVLVVAEQYPQALTALDHVRALHAEKPGHFFFRAISYDHLHLRKEAIEAYNKFLELSQGKSPDEEFKARQRVRILERELNKR